MGFGLHTTSQCLHKNDTGRPTSLAVMNAQAAISAVPESIDKHHRGEKEYLLEGREMAKK
ncbi:MAG: hypothetical protein D6730_24010 [Bacteroidetes bacterium]|nr:MAG: hypothetical protein D6730_24010 [Bacteroidota bacterium]